MTTCISRRACSDKYSFPLSKDGKTKNFVWTEYRCPNEVPEGIKTCVDCSIKITKYKYQSVPKCDHGLVGGPYPVGSKLYGSPYYIDLIKKGWTILETDEKRAKDAIAKAISDMPAKKVVTDSAPVNVNIPTAVAVETLVASPTPAKKPRKPRVVKPSSKSVIPVVNPVMQEPARVTVQSDEKAIMVESTNSPIIVSETIVVKLTKVKYNGKEWYFDSASGKLYEKTTAGVGPYKGRYNTETEKLNTEYPDSDEEL
jgi:hypothetical protein